MEFFNQSFWQGFAASLAVIIMVALLTPIKNLLSEYWNRRRLKKHNQRLTMLTWEKEHLSKVRKSSVALSRAVYSDMFMLLLFLSLGLGIPILGPIAASLNPLFSSIVKFFTPLSVPIWFVALMISFQNIKKFNNLNNYAKAIEKLNSKIETVAHKIDKISANKQNKADA